VTRDEFRLGGEIFVPDIAALNICRQRRKSLLHAASGLVEGRGAAMVPATRFGNVLDLGHLENTVRDIVVIEPGRSSAKSPKAVTKFRNREFARAESIWPTISASS
jgi:hypothetical protein